MDAYTLGVEKTAEVLDADTPVNVSTERGTYYLKGEVDVPNPKTNKARKENTTHSDVSLAEITEAEIREKG